MEAKGLTFVPISAATRQGVDVLPALVYSRLKELPPVKVFEAEYVKPSLVDAPTRPFTVERTGAHEFTVDAPGWSAFWPVPMWRTMKACSISRPSWAIPAFWMSWSARTWKRTIPLRSANMSSITFIEARHVI